MKIKELLKSLIETQKQINESLKGLKEDLKPKLEEIKINGERMTASCNLTVGKLENYIESNLYTKEQTVEAINKEYDYRKEYETCEDENYALLQLIEKYCKYKDKYEVIDMFKQINKEYEIKRRKEK